MMNDNPFQDKNENLKKELFEITEKSKIPKKSVCIFLRPNIRKEESSFANRIFNILNI